MDIFKIFTLIGVSLTFLGTLFSIYYTRKNMKNTKFIDTVTSERIAWMETYRNYLSEFLTVIRFRKDCDERVTQLITLQCKIQLHLNPTDYRDNKIVELVNEITKVYSNAYREGLVTKLINGIPKKINKDDLKQKCNEVIEKNYSQLIKLSKDYLKEEWERVKEETQKGYFVKGEGDDWFGNGFENGYF